MTYGPRAIFVDYEGRSRRRSRGLVVRVAGRSVSFARNDRTDKFDDACPGCVHWQSVVGKNAVTTLRALDPVPPMEC